MKRVILLRACVSCCLFGIGQNGQISFRKTGKEHCGYMVCGSKIFFVPSEKYEPNIQPTL